MKRGHLNASGLGVKKGLPVNTTASDTKLCISTSDRTRVPDVRRPLRVWMRLTAIVSAHVSYLVCFCMPWVLTFARSLVRSEGGADCAQHEQPLQTMDDHHQRPLNVGRSNNPNGDLGPGEQGLIM